MYWIFCKTFYKKVKQDKNHFSFIVFGIKILLKALLVSMKVQLSLIKYFGVGICLVLHFMFIICFFSNRTVF